MSEESLARKNVLVVEDEPSIIKVCQRVLSNEGFEVDIAGDGQLAKDLIQNKRYDYFLLDIRMPILDGKALYNWLKVEHPKLAKKVMFMTGESIGIETQSFLKETGAAFLIKPFTINELKTKAREVFRD